MGFLGEALSQTGAPAGSASASAAVPPTPPAPPAPPARESDSPLVFALKLFGFGAACVGLATYASHKIAERDAARTHEEP